MSILAQGNAVQPLDSSLHGPSQPEPTDSVQSCELSPAEQGRCGELGVVGGGAGLLAGELVRPRSPGDLGVCVPMALRVSGL